MVFSHCGEGGFGKAPQMPGNTVIQKEKTIHKYQNLTNILASLSRKIERFLEYSACSALKDSCCTPGGFGGKTPNSLFLLNEQTVRQKLLMAISATKLAENATTREAKGWRKTFLVTKFKNQAPVLTADIFSLKLVCYRFL